jgi:CubicO group peptidase (beta-lactamase class C family)
MALFGCRFAAELGETTRSDMTFSVAKSYLSILAGLAWDRGLIGDPHDKVRLTVDDGGFDPPHNDGITWHHLLQQTSEWEGVLWDKPDLIDRNRSAGGRPSTAPKGTHRDLQKPGEFWEYNDVRVNRLSLALLQLWRRPLPEVFRELVMEPIGASPEWEWHGYRNSYVEIDGERMQSGAGGGHWGGGVFISDAPGPDRAAAVAARHVGRKPHPLRSLDRADARTLPAPPQLRLSLVAQHRAWSLPERLGGQLLRPRRRRQPDLDRSRERSRRGAALDRPCGDGRVHEADHGGPAPLTQRGDPVFPQNGEFFDCSQGDPYRHRNWRYVPRRAGIPAAKRGFRAWRIKSAEPGIASLTTGRKKQAERDPSIRLVDQPDDRTAQLGPG